MTLPIPKNKTLNCSFQSGHKFLWAVPVLSITLLIVKLLFGSTIPKHFSFNSGLKHVRHKHVPQSSGLSLMILSGTWCVNVMYEYPFSTCYVFSMENIHRKQTVSQSFLDFFSSGNTTVFLSWCKNSLKAQVWDVFLPGVLAKILTNCNIFWVDSDGPVNFNLLRALFCLLGIHTARLHYLHQPHCQMAWCLFQNNLEPFSKCSCQFLFSLVNMFIFALILLFSAFAFFIIQSPFL